MILYSISTCIGNEKQGRRWSIDLTIKTRKKRRVDAGPATPYLFSVVFYSYINSHNLFYERVPRNRGMRRVYFLFIRTNEQEKTKKKSIEACKTFSIERNGAYIYVNLCCLSVRSFLPVQLISPHYTVKINPPTPAHGHTQKRSKI